MLRSIKISRFKSIRDMDLDFGRVNLFIGGNGAGKSNLLEAIGVVSAALYRGVSDSELARKGVRLTPPALMKSAFKNFDLPKTFRIEASLDPGINYAIELSASERDTHLSFFSEKCEFRGTKTFGRSGRGVTVLGSKVAQKSWVSSRSLWDQSRVAFPYPEEVQTAFDELARYAIYSPQTEFLREIKSGKADEPPVGLHGEGLAAAVASLMEQARQMRPSKKASANAERSILTDAISLVWLPGWTRSVRVGSLDSILKSRELASTDGNVIYFIDRFMNEKRNKLSAYDSSEGTLFLLFMTVLMAHRDSPKIFALDNVDSALNPAMTRKVIELITSISRKKTENNLALGPAQVFLTSHNPTSLDAFDLFDDDQRVFILFRNDDGHTTAKRLKPKSGWSREDWTANFSGKKLSQLWIDGEISGALGSM
ncbi:AAA family ATPase [Rhizobium sp. CFBP 13726]|uniref:AAA family ATPase n=1 Tax=Rhizobium sp. CFBP 13726 TaxID=2775296 RepID=UPI0017845035|nr:ATP-binding protein [Rhizobium sp. CFBP 13726]MBD8650624.1 AAA family ATPase [Rhizobium sp. CFBP 13726]